MPEPSGNVSAMDGLTWTEADFERISKPQRANQAAHPQFEHTYDPWPELDDHDDDLNRKARRRPTYLRKLLVVLALSFVAAVIYFGPSYLRSAISDHVETAMQKIAPLPIGSPDMGIARSVRPTKSPSSAGTLQGQDAVSTGGTSSLPSGSEPSKTNLSPVSGGGANIAVPPIPQPAGPAIATPGRSADQIVASVSHAGGAALDGPKSNESPIAHGRRSNGNAYGPHVTASGRLVRQIQILLAGFGYYRHRIDGVEGPETRAAIRWFQIRYGLRQTGRSSRSLLHALERAHQSPSTSK